MIPATVQLEPAVRGDKWQGVPAIGPVLINGVAPSLPLARIRMQLRNKSGQLGMTLDSEPGEGIFPIEISNSATWLAYIPEVQPLPLESGEWEWDMEFYEGTDIAPITFYKGILRVLPDATR